jgi:hypothetical protein
MALLRLRRPVCWRARTEFGIGEQITQFPYDGLSGGQVYVGGAEVFLDGGLSPRRAGASCG